jgi:hypothetical protein
MDGCLVHTTAEIVLVDLTASQGITFSRRPDAATGYNELVVDRGTDHGGRPPRAASKL